VFIYLTPQNIYILQFSPSPNFVVDFLLIGTNFLVDISHFFWSFNNLSWLSDLSFSLSLQSAMDHHCEDDSPHSNPNSVFLFIWFRRLWPDPPAWRRWFEFLFFIKMCVWVCDYIYFQFRFLWFYARSPIPIDLVDLVFN
jgi:hypothetical protein